MLRDYGICLVFPHIFSVEQNTEQSLPLTTNHDGQHIRGITTKNRANGSLSPRRG